MLLLDVLSLLFISVARVLCLIDHLTHHKCSPTLLSSKLQHNNNQTIREKKIDIVATCDDGSRVMYKSSNGLFFRSNVMEILAHNIIDVLALPVAGSKARGTKLEFELGDPSEVLDKLKYVHPLFTDARHERSMYGVRLNFLTEVDSHNMKFQQLMKLRWNFISETFLHGCGNEAYRRLVSSFGAILALDAILGNTDRSGKNCRLSNNGTWIAFDNEEMRANIPPSSLLKWNPASECLTKFLPGFSTETIWVESVAAIGRHLANVSHDILEQQLRLRLASDLLIRAYDLLPLPLEAKPRLLKMFSPVLNAQSYQAVPRWIPVQL